MPLEPLHPRRRLPRAIRSLQGRDVDLADLADALGQQVRVGGLVTDLEPRGVRIDDGTASALVVLEGEAAQLLPLIEPGDAINASGTVESVEGELAVVVTDPAGIALAADPTAAGPAATTTPLAALPGGPPTGATEASLGDPLGGLAGLAGLGTLAAIDGAVGRGHVPPAVAGRRRLGARVAARLAAFAGAATVERRHHRRAVAGPAGRPRPDPRSGHARLSTRHARADRLDARSRAGLSSPEFRASEAAIGERNRSCRTRIPA